MFLKKNICKLSFTVMVVLSLVMFIFGLYLCLESVTLFFEWEILGLFSSSVMFSVLLDFSSVLFMSLVMFISSMVVLYTNDYMFGDCNIDRFVILVLLFVFSMMMMIISPNLISILLGWDGLGLVSYCLVIYYQNEASYSAGMLTAMSNRVGDVALLISIAWMLNYGSWNYVFYLDSKDSIVGMMVILAAFTKSAQIPFSSWLPAAMAAPTPVSALVHSSTLVTAGVYLLIRFYELIEGLGYLWIVGLVGSLTMFMAGLVANLEYDLSSIIAMSTLSQLGLMMMTIGMGLVDLAFFHLLTHALFSALLFLCAGVIIHGMGNLQDIRGMGCLVSMPVVSVCFNVSNLALCGMPFLAGFYSKDLILEKVLMSNMNILMFIMIFVSTSLTVMYSFRLVYYTMSGEFNFYSFHNMGDGEWGMIWPMFLMLLMVIVGGSMLSWVLLDCPEMICLTESFKMIIMVVSIIGGWLGYELTKMDEFGSSFLINWYKMVNFMGSMWYMPFLSTQMISYYPLFLGGKLNKVSEKGWLEEFGGQGGYMFIKKMSIIIQMWQLNEFSIFFISFYLWIVLYLLYWII
uniref:NADH-ubiquinone oxidoreductase chain 5 n=1 Tax=Polionemobius taprobanensis TaxID=269706 RepID=A0A6B9VXX5_9ORTH|nr:NADH dehydrogenase subunit 5 [Polionemobius taprobanensis]QHQ73112.1 NADH dehydrogenase subunit 5 [Polionemobius taprobanensis]